MVSFQSSESVPDNPISKTSLGIDAGIESFVPTSTGKLIKAPRFLLSQLRKLKLLQRRLKHKTKRSFQLSVISYQSSNWLKLQNRIARLHEKIANTRRDLHFKLSHQLCDDR